MITADTSSPRSAAPAAAFGVEADLTTWPQPKAAHYYDLLAEVRPFGPTTALVRSLAAAGTAMAVASGSSVTGIDTSLRAIGLDGPLPLRVSVDEVCAGRPAPDVFLAAAEL